MQSVNLSTKPELSLSDQFTRFCLSLGMIPTRPESVFTPQLRDKLLSTLATYFPEADLKIANATALNPFGVAFLLITGEKDGNPLLLPGGEVLTLDTNQRTRPEWGLLFQFYRHAGVMGIDFQSIMVDDFTREAILSHFSSNKLFLKIQNFFSFITNEKLPNGLEPQRLSSNRQAILFSSKEKDESIVYSLGKNVPSLTFSQLFNSIYSFEKVEPDKNKTGEIAHFLRNNKFKIYDMLTSLPEDPTVMERAQECFRREFYFPLRENPDANITADPVIIAHKSLSPNPSFSIENTFYMLDIRANGVPCYIHPDSQVVKEAAHPVYVLIESEKGNVNPEVYSQEFKEKFGLVISFFTLKSALSEFSSTCSRETHKVLGIVSEVQQFGDIIGGFEKNIADHPLYFALRGSLIPSIVEEKGEIEEFKINKVRKGFFVSSEEGTGISLMVNTNHGDHLVLLEINSLSCIPCHYPFKVLHHFFD